MPKIELVYAIQLMCNCNATKINRKTKLSYQNAESANSSKNLTYAPLVIVADEYLTISSFPLLNIKLWLNENCHLTFIFIQIHSFEDAKMLFSLADNFIYN